MTVHMDFTRVPEQHPITQWADVLAHSLEPLSTSLPLQEIHVWQAAFSSLLLAEQDMLAWLSQAEKARALSFKFQADRNRFIASHGLLRLILAAYTKQNPDVIRFVFNQYGKPQLASDCALPIYFNLSHSVDRVLVAISSSGEVGIDVERSVPDYSWEEIVHQYFSYQEQKYLYSLGPEKQADAFFTIWTRKEAYWKAAGIGLSGLDAGETGLAVEQTITLKQLLLDEEYRGAVAMCGESTVVRCFRLLLAL